MTGSSPNVQFLYSALLNVDSLLEKCQTTNVSKTSIKDIILTVTKASPTETDIQTMLALIPKEKLYHILHEVCFLKSILNYIVDDSDFKPRETACEYRYGKENDEFVFFLHVYANPGSIN